MKKIALITILATLTFLAVGLSAEVHDPTPEAAPSTAPATALENPFSTPLADALACSANAARRPFQPNYCGDPCYDPGQVVGCIDTSGPHWVRTFCTCSNGYLVC